MGKWPPTSAAARELIGATQTHFSAGVRPVRPSRMGRVAALREGEDLRGASWEGNFFTAKAPRKIREDLGFGFSDLKPWRSWRLGILNYSPISTAKTFSSFAALREKIFTTYSPIPRGSPAPNRRSKPPALSFPTKRTN